jgi:ATP-binding cassette subfamily B protein
VAEETPEPKKRRGDLPLFRRLFREAREYRGGIVLLFFVNLLATPLALLFPVPLQLAVDVGIGDVPPPPWLRALAPEAWLASPSSVFVVAGAMLVLVTLLSQAQALAAWILQTWIGERLVIGFRERLFSHLQRLSLAFHDEKGTAESVYRVQNDAPALQAVAVHGVVRFTTAIVKLAAMLWVTALLAPSLALIALVGLPILLVISRIYRARLRAQWKEAKERESRAMAVVQESLGALRVVKAFGQEERERERYRVQAHASLLAHLRAVLAHGGFDLVVGLVIGVASAIVLYVGASQVREGSLTLGELLLVVGYLTQVFDPIREIGTKFAEVQRALASADRVFALLDEPPEAPERPDAVALPRARGEVVLEGVSFGYGRGRVVLRDVSFAVPAGTRVGVAGRSGAGKTTLLSLLPRFYDPDAGRVLLDGRDVRDYRLADLRAQFAIVLQDPVLFSTTVAENVAYGRAGASREEIEAAARAANAHDFIAALPQGYDTAVGERGMKLSGGERQRIALARAFLKDAPVLILDEPTSSVDLKTEAAILDAMERLMRGKTTFLIAHRLETLEGCDLRLEVRDGRVVERGLDLAGIALDSGPAGSSLA